MEALGAGVGEALGAVAVEAAGAGAALCAGAALLAAGMLEVPEEGIAEAGGVKVPFSHSRSRRSAL